MNIEDLGTAWNVSLKEMSSFVNHCYEKNGVLKDSCKKKWAKTIYPDDSKQSSSRLENFILTAISMRDKGYITPLDYEVHGSIQTESDVKVLLVCGLPRVICEGNLIDDGRHKLAVLLALGIKRTPVVKIKVLSSKKMVSDDIAEFELNLIEGLNKFKHSVEWEKFKETDDYIKVKPKRDLS